MMWRDAVALASPHPAIRRDADGSTWICYANGSLDRIDQRGRQRRMPHARPEAWVDWTPAEETR